MNIVFKANLAELYYKMASGCTSSNAFNMIYISIDIHIFIYIYLYIYSSFSRE